MSKSAGVYGREIDRSHSTPGFAGSIGAIVLDSEKGPIGPTFISSIRDLIDLYGLPKQDELAKHAALTFMESATELWVKRITKDGDLTASVDVEDESSNTVFTVYAENPGKWGNDLSIRIASDELDGEMFFINVFENGEHVEEWGVSLITDKKNGFGQPAYLEDVINGNSFYIRVEDNVSEDGDPSILYKFHNESVTISANNDAHDFEIAEGDIAADLSEIDAIDIMVSGQRGEDIVVDTSAGIVKFNVSDAGSISVSEDTADMEYWAGGGELSLANGDLDSDPIESGDIQSAWEDFFKKDEYNIQLLMNGGYSIEGVQMKMIDVAEYRKDCIAILDVPESMNTAQQISDYSNKGLNANTSWAALYCGWPVVSDQYSGKTLTLPPSGYVASVMSKTEAVAEVWYAPAGLRRAALNVLGVNGEFTQGDRDLIYRANVNPIVEFTGQGTVIWGQKTLQRFPSALDRVNVRMLMIQIMSVASRTLRPFVFELNNNRSRGNIQSILHDFMTGIKQRGGVYDFKVQCDSGNNPPRVIDANEMNVDIYVQPTKVAEVINLSTIITRTGVSFN